MRWADPDDHMSRLDLKSGTIFTVRRLWRLGTERDDFSSNRHLALGRVLMNRALWDMSALAATAAQERTSAEVREGVERRRL